MTFVYKGDAQRGAIWAEQFASKMPRMPFCIWPEVADAAQVRFLAAWQPPERVEEAFPNLEILFSVGAGVDQFDFSALPRHLKVVRMVEPGLTACMCEYVSWAVLSLHRDVPLYLRQQQRGEWKEHPVRPASSRRVGVMGMGTLGRAALAQLRQLGFDCAGWSRSRRSDSGIRCYAGEAELDDFLARTDILVCLLPLTPETRGILGRRIFDALPARRFAGQRGTRRPLGAAGPAGRLGPRTALGRHPRRLRTRAAAAGPSILGPSAHLAHAAHRQRHPGRDGRGGTAA